MLGSFSCHVLGALVYPLGKYYGYIGIMEKWKLRILGLHIRLGT